ncbi:MAG: nickel insertion protein, partial [Brachybacterium tyrofermentans]
HDHDHDHDHDHENPHATDRTPDHDAAVPVPTSDVDVPAHTIPAHMAGGPHEHGGRKVPAGVAPGIGELATPTGVALMRGLAGTSGPQPMLLTEAVGVGAGTKETPGRPNVVRVLVGRRGYGASPDPAHSASQSASASQSGSVGSAPSVDPSALAASELPLPAGPGGDSVGPRAADAHDTPTSAVQLEANVDDLDPRLWPRIIDELLDLGALDAWHTPITMKRGRPAITIHALVRERSVQEIAAVLMDRTGTLGVRMHRVERVIRTREFTEVEVQGQRIAVKIARDARGAVVRREPEFRDVAAAARVLGISERAMLDLAKESATSLTEHSD